MNRDRLPRLMYAGDVLVENYMHGSALMYRLLERYPADKLLIVEEYRASDPTRRLQGAQYRIGRPFVGRLLHTRYGEELSTFAHWRGPLAATLLDRRTRDFPAEAILTVVHGHGWQTAADLARRRGLPLYLIAHDRWQDTFLAPARVKARLEPRFAAIWRGAAGRFCISPYMAAAYEAATGVPATVLYPSRARDMKTYATVSPRVARPGTPFTVGYAGSISAQGLMDALALAARILAELGGRLLLIGPYTAEVLAKHGLAGDNVEVRGFVNPRDLPSLLRSEVDALIASTSFEDRHVQAMALLFPSKLTDYTAIGVPIVAHGPPSASVISWARENPGVAALVTDMDPLSMRTVLERLMTDQAWRAALAAKALAVGQVQFSSDAAEETLLGAIARDYFPSIAGER